MSESFPKIRRFSLLVLGFVSSISAAIWGLLCVVTFAGDMEMGGTGLSWSAPGHLVRLRVLSALVVVIAVALSAFAGFALAHFDVTTGRPRPLKRLQLYGVAALVAIPVSLSLFFAFVRIIV